MGGSRGGALHGEVVNKPSCEIPGDVEVCNLLAGGGRTHWYHVAAIVLHKIDTDDGPLRQQMWNVEVQEEPAHVEKC